MECRIQTYQSVACQASKSDDASSASEIGFVKCAMPSCRPLRAILAWWNARSRVSLDCEIQARCDAENARIECITKAWDAARPKNLTVLVLDWRRLKGSVILGHHIGPQGQFRGSIPEHFVRDGGQMMYQAQIGSVHGAPLRLRVHSKLGERKLPRLGPELDGSFDLWSPQQIRLLRRRGRVWHHGCWAIHVVTTNLMFCAITAGFELAKAAVLYLGTYHWGNDSSHRMCLLLHVLHPLRDLVWLRLEGPPPGPGIAADRNQVVWRRGEVWPTTLLRNQTCDFVKLYLWSRRFRIYKWSC